LMLPLARQQWLTSSFPELCATICPKARATRAAWIRKSPASCNTFCQVACWRARALFLPSSLMSSSHQLLYFYPSNPF
jgi:hypothetical protein